MNSESSVPTSHLRAESRAAFHVLPQNDLTLEGMRVACAEAGLRRFDVKASLERAPAALIRQLALALGAPSESLVGLGWDGLLDLTRDLDWTPGAGYVLVIERGDTIASLPADLVATLVDVLEATIRHWRDEIEDEDARGAPKPFHVFAVGGSIARQHLLSALREPLCDHTQSPPVVIERPEGITRVDCFGEASALVEAGAEVEAVLKLLRQRGIAKISSRYVLAGLLRIPVWQARHVIDRSDTWADERDVMRLHRQAADIALRSMKLRGD